MSKIGIGAVVSTLANVGVVAGLVFVGFQLQQDREIAAAALVQGLVDTEIAWAELVEQDSDAWTRGLAGEDLTVAEHARFDVVASALQSRFWTAYRHSRGLLGDFDPERQVRAWALQLNQNPGLMAWWVKYLEANRYINPTPTTQWHHEVNAELDRLNFSGPESDVR